MPSDVLDAEEEQLLTVRREADVPRADGPKRGTNLL